MGEDTVEAEGTIDLTIDKEATTFNEMAIDLTLKLSLFERITIGNKIAEVVMRTKSKSKDLSLKETKVGKRKSAQAVKTKRINPSEH